MTDQRALIYVPITSISKADGGRTRIVTGVAGSDRLDYEGQRADYAWLKRELSTWFSPPAEGGLGGNMREDHKKGGVGKAIALEFDDDRRMVTVTSKAVDRDTVFKLDEGVLQGYSWGAKTVPGNPVRIQKSADGTETVKSGKIVEVSYVDAPCNADCYVDLVKSVGKKGLQRTAVLGDLADPGIIVIQAGEANPREVLKGLLADIGKRDVSPAERERLGDKGHAIDTGQDHPSFPIKTRGDLENAIKAYGRANPADRAAVRRHIISEAKRLGAADLIPDAWKSVQGLLKQSMADCDCCDDCGPDCDGSCCDECRMMADSSKAVAAGPVAILAGVKALEQGETDTEHRAFLGKLAAAVAAWTREEGASLDFGSFKTLAALSKAGGEPDLAKRRTFYSTQNRAQVEQAMQNLHETLGLFMEGASSIDADKDQRNDTLTGQDAPAPGDTPGGPGTAPGDGNPGDGNLAFDPEMVRDGDPAIRTPDGQQDGRAQGEGGTNTWPPAGDSPGQGPGDKGKGEAPTGKGRDGDPAQAQQSPSKAAKVERKLAEARAELAELRKSMASQTPTAPVQVNQTLGQQPRSKAGGKGLRRDIAALTDTVRKTLESQQQAAPLELRTAPDPAEAVARLEKRLRKVAGRAEDEGALRAEVAKATAAVQALVARPADGPQQAAELRLELAKALDKLERRMAKRLTSQPAPAPDLGPLGAQIDELRKAITAQQAALQAARPDAPPMIDNTLLLADLTRAAYEQTRKDLTETGLRLEKRVKRAERELRQAAAANSQRLQKVVQSVDELGRRPHPAGPALIGPQEKTYAVNATIERSLPAELMGEVALYNELAKSEDQVVAAGAKQQLRKLVQENGLTG